MPKYIVDVFAEGESDEWLKEYIMDQLDCSYKDIKQIDNKETIAAIKLLRSCLDHSKDNIQHSILKYMNDAIDVLERNNNERTSN